MSQDVASAIPKTVNGTHMVTARLFCCPSNTELGQHTLTVIKALLSVQMPVRLLALAAYDFQSPWAQGWGVHEKLFLTPIVGDYVNLVAGTPDDWHRLHTSTVRNCLITPDPPPAYAKDFSVAMRYELVVVPDEDLATDWRALGRQAAVVPKQWTNGHARLLQAALVNDK